MGQVYTQTKNVRVDLLPSGDAYSAGDCIGTAGGLTTDGAKIPLKNALRHPTHSGVLQSLRIFDKLNQKPALTVLLFKSKPVGSFTDNAKPAGLDEDLDGDFYFLGSVSIAAADWISIAGGSASTAIVTKTGIGLVVHEALLSDSDIVIDNPMLYAVFITSGTPDYTGAGAGELVAEFGFLQD